MRIRRGIVKTVKWGGPVVAVVIAWLCWESVEYLTAFNSPFGMRANLTEGGLVFCYNPDWQLYKDVDGFQFLKWPSYVSWWFEYRTRFTDRSVFIPGWFPFIITVGLSVFAWRSDTHDARRRKLGQCPKCNYSRAGLGADVVCPECGAAPLSVGPNGK